MGTHTNVLPQLGGTLFVTDAGLETELIFRHGQDLPGFAAFPLLASPEGRRLLRGYYHVYGAIARSHGAGFILESMTWRASRDWGAKLGYNPGQVIDFNRRAMAFLHDLKAEFFDLPHVVVSGCVGPRGDGYVTGDTLTVDQAAAYHHEQIASLADGGADMIGVFTMNRVEEALGMVQIAVAEGVPVAVGFTTEIDGRLPSGQPLRSAIEQIDRETGAAPAYYMVNCAHPDHFAATLDGEAWTDRIRAVRANASTRSHAELDACTELDSGDIDHLERCYADLRGRLRNFNVVGGCCGTDERHVAAMCGAMEQRDAAAE